MHKFPLRRFGTRETCVHKWPFTRFEWFVCSCSQTRARTHTRASACIGRGPGRRAGTSCIHEVRVLARTEARAHAHTHTHAHTRATRETCVHKSPFTRFGVLSRTHTRAHTHTRVTRETRVHKLPFMRFAVRADTHITPLTSINSTPRTTTGFTSAKLMDYESYNNEGSNQLSGNYTFK